MINGSISPDRVGLCASCQYARIVNHPRGGEDYFRCGKHDEDPAYPKYPPLPVRYCTGYAKQDDPT